MVYTYRFYEEEFPDENAGPLSNVRMKIYDCRGAGCRCKCQCTPPAMPALPGPHCATVVLHDPWAGDYYHCIRKE
jgi:hypothetical protein